MLISLRHRLINFPDLFKSDQNTPSTLKRVSACFCPVAAISNSLVGGHSVCTSSNFPVSRLSSNSIPDSSPPPKIVQDSVGESRGLLGRLARSRGAFAVFWKQDCRTRCRLRFSAVAQRNCEKLVSLRRRALPRCPTLALAQTFTVWRHSKFPLILVPPPAPSP